jgi:EpsD family peptidyl-prolyl cis-trans isomerase
VYAIEQISCARKRKKSKHCFTCEKTMKTKTQSILNTSFFFRNTLIIAMSLFVMSGCSESKKPATQIVAKVNDDEISVHQVNTAMAKIPNVTAENADKVRAEVITKLINQQLAVQQAEKQKIDRSAEVMMMVDAAKREILTRAYLSQLVSGLPKPSEEEAGKFYDAHPELFAERRIYKVQEIIIPAANAPVAELQQLAADKPMEEIVNTLKAKQIPFTTNAGVRAAEQISLPILAEISKVPDGKTTVIETPQAVTVVHVVSSEVAPVSKEAALKRIPQFLMNENAKVAINEDLERLKSTAKIEYINVPDNLAQKAAETPAASTKTAADNPATGNVEKGIAGL